MRGPGQAAERGGITAESRAHEFPQLRTSSVGISPYDAGFCQQSWPAPMAGINRFIGRGRRLPLVNVSGSSSHGLAGGQWKKS